MEISLQVPRRPASLPRRFSRLFAAPHLDVHAFHDLECRLIQRIIIARHAGGVDQNRHLRHRGLGDDHVGDHADVGDNPCELHAFIFAAAVSEIIRQFQRTESRLGENQIFFLLQRADLTVQRRSRLYSGCSARSADSVPLVFPNSSSHGYPS